MRLLGNAVIGIGTQESTAVPLDDMDSITAFPPAMDGTTIALEISPDGGSSWFAVGDAGSPVTITPGQTVTAVKIHGTHVRINSDTNETAERTIPIYGSRGK